MYVYIKPLIDRRFFVDCIYVYAYDIKYIQICETGLDLNRDE